MSDRIPAMIYPEHLQTIAGDPNATPLERQLAEEALRARSDSQSQGKWSLHGRDELIGLAYEGIEILLVDLDGDSKDWSVKIISHHQLIEWLDDRQPGDTEQWETDWGTLGVYDHSIGALFNDVIRVIELRRKEMRDKRLLDDFWSNWNEAQRLRPLDDRMNSAEGRALIAAAALLERSDG